MDEILSSIRQIIADDDAAVAPPPVRPAAASSVPSQPPVASRAAPEPLALSPSQMISPAARSAPEPAGSSDLSGMLAGLDEPEPEPMAEMLADEAQLVDPEDIAFEAEPEPTVAPPMARAPEPRPAVVQPKPAPRPMMSVAQAAPLPDPTLSEDLAEKLLAPTTDAAVHDAMARLGSMSNTGIGAMTVEAMIRGMLKPMLKDWLDENLPSLVESMVEREIARISRGVK
jgi:uncharacterized protein